MEFKYYEVYEVRYKGIPVYIGSGEQDVRHLHVRSGHSHNAELNKLFFTDPDNLLVTVLRKDLTKEESLETEKGFIEAIQPQFNIVYTNKHKKVLTDARKRKLKPRSFRSKVK